VTLSALLLLAACSRSEGPRRLADGTLPNVVIVLIDTLRPDHLGFYGYPSETAPFLSDLARGSLVFFEALSSSSATAPATASLFTALYPTRHGVIEGFFAHRHHVAGAEMRGESVLSLNRMPLDLPTLPELLRGAGYRTFGLATNINIGPEMGFDRGFDRFERLDLRRIDSGHQEEIVGSRSMESVPAEEVYERLLDWEQEIREGDEPYFLYLHLNDPHEPYHKRKPWYRDDPAGEENLESAYDSEIHYTDRVLEKLYRRFELERDSVLIILSDHGEAFGEHGLYGHPHSLYRVLNRILLMVSAPALELRTGISTASVSIVDVLPTLLDLLDRAPPAARDGWSLRPLFTAGDAQSKLARRLDGRSLFAYRARLYPERRETWAVMRGEWKLMDEFGRWELYNTETDPSEERDLLNQEPRVQADLRRQLLAFQTEGDAPATESVDVRVDAETLEKLKALGYADDR
jgi:arylsulfatase A-like enzyme